MNEQEFDKLDEQLRALGRADRRETPSPAIGRALRKEFRRVHSPARFYGWTAAGIAAAAAIVWFTAAMAPRIAAPRRAPAIETETPVILRRVEKPPMKIASGPAPRVAPVRKKTPRAPAVERPKEPAEVATQFMPVTADYASREITGSIVRVRLPRTALTSFGLPVNQNRLYESIQADVVIGEDGVARAIRFIQ